MKRIAIYHREEITCMLEKESLMIPIRGSCCEHYSLKSLLRLVGAEDLVEEKTSSKDVSRSKPDPDVMRVTLLRTGLYAHVALMIGDTAYDIEAARTAHVRTIAFSCGGWKDADLVGTFAFYDGRADL